MTTDPIARPHNVTDTQAVIDTATQAVMPAQLEPGSVYSFPVPKGGEVKIVDLDPESLAQYPRRKAGTVAVQSANSFVAYLAKHGQSYSEVYADRINKRIVGVINANMGVTGDGVDDYAGWGDHRVVFDVVLTDAWKEWVENDGKMLSQTEFAEFIEDHLSDINTPAAAEMLEVAQSISAKVDVTFESTKRLSTGEAQLEYREDMSAQAGKGTLEIPTLIGLGIAPFEGSAPYAIDARFRYRINGGNLKLAYKLVEPELKIKDAFEGVVNDITEQLNDTVVLDGVPAEPRRPALSFNS